MISSIFITDIISCNKKDNKVLNIADFIDNSANKNFSKNTIFSIATMEWLLKGDHHTKTLMRIMYKYYNLYPETTPIRYGKGLEEWFTKGAKRYRSDYDCGCIAWSCVVAWIASDMNHLKALIRRAVKATNNSPIAMKYCEMIAVAIYLNKKYHSIDKTLQYLIKNYGYEPIDDIDNFCKTQAFTTNAKSNAYAGVHCFLHSSNYMECVSKAFAIDSRFDIVPCIAGMLAESFYNEAPQNLSHYLLSYLPKEFLEVMFQFDVYTPMSTNTKTSRD